MDRRSAQPSAPSSAGGGAKVRVGVRVRPSASFAQNNLNLDPGTNTVRLFIPHNSRDVVNNKKQAWVFAADAVHPNSSQEEVYDSLARDAVDGVLAGHSATIIAYGQTGSGKSFTMLGDTRAYRSRGITPRALAQLMAGVQARSDLDVVVTVSLCEIYMDSITDLLAASKHVAVLAAPLVARYRLDVAAGSGRAATSASLLPPINLPGSSNLASDLSIVDDPVEGVCVRGLSQVPVYCEEDALGALFAGEAARVTAQHSLNRHSSRSHSVFTVTLRQRRRTGGGREVVTFSKLTLVDLAGSERLKRTVGVPHVPSPAGAGDARGLGAGGSGGQQLPGPASAPGSVSPMLVGLPTTSRPAGMGGGGRAHPSSSSGLASAIVNEGAEVLYRESVSINSSLGYLEQCVNALRRRKPDGERSARSSAGGHRLGSLTGLLAPSPGHGSVGGANGAVSSTRRHSVAGYQPTKHTGGSIGTSSSTSTTSAASMGATGWVVGEGGGSATQFPSSNSNTGSALPFGLGSRASARAPTRNGGSGTMTSDSGRIIPFRQSKLTSLLRSCFGGTTATVFIACICGEANHLDETLTTLRLAQRMARLSSRPGPPRTHIDTRALTQQQADTIASLTRELALHDAIAGRCGVQYGEYTPEERNALAERLRAFIHEGSGALTANGPSTTTPSNSAWGHVDAAPSDGSTGLSETPFQVESVRQMQEALRIAREMVQQAQAQAEVRVRAQLQAQGQGLPTNSSAAPSNGATSIFAGLDNGSGDGTGSNAMDDVAMVGVGELDALVSGLALGRIREKDNHCDTTDPCHPSMSSPPLYGGEMTSRRSSRTTAASVPGSGLTARRRHSALAASPPEPSPGGTRVPLSSATAPPHAPAAPATGRRASMPPVFATASGGSSTATATAPAYGGHDRRGSGATGAVGLASSSGAGQTTAGWGSTGPMGAKAFADAETERSWNRYTSTPGLGQDSLAALQDASAKARHDKGAVMAAAEAVRAARARLQLAQDAAAKAEPALAPVSAAAEPVSAAQSAAASSGSRLQGDTSSLGSPKAGAKLKGGAADTTASVATPKASTAIGKPSPAAVPQALASSSSSSSSASAPKSPALQHAELPAVQDASELAAASAAAAAAAHERVRIEEEVLLQRAKTYKAACASSVASSASLTLAMRELLEGFETWYAAGHGGRLPAYSSTSSLQKLGAAASESQESDTGRAPSISTRVGIAAAAATSAAPAPTRDRSYSHSGSYNSDRSTANKHAAANDDCLDAGELFEEMQWKRIEAEDPSSLPFFRAMKKVKQAEKTGKK